MAYAQAQVQAATQFGDSVSARTQAYGSSVSSGNLLVVFVATLNSGITVTVTDSLGNTYSQAGSYSVHATNTARSSIWYCVSAFSGANTVTVTPSSSAFVTISVAEFSGNRLSSPLNSTATANGNGTSVATGSITAVAGELVVGMYNQGSLNLASCTVASPFTMRTNILGATVGLGMGTADDTAAPGSEGATFTTSGTVNWTAIGASFKLPNPPAAAKPMVISRISIDEAERRARTLRRITNKRVMYLPPPAIAEYLKFTDTIEGVDYIYLYPFNNLQASTAPGVDDDASYDYAPGSIWVDKVAEDAYICIRATVGAAVWKKISP